MIGLMADSQSVRICPICRATVYSISLEELAVADNNIYDSDPPYFDPDDFDPDEGYEDDYDNFE